MPIHNPRKHTHTQLNRWSRLSLESSFFPLLFLFLPLELEYNHILVPEFSLCRRDYFMKSGILHSHKTTNTIRKKKTTARELDVKKLTTCQLDNQGYASELRGYSWTHILSQRGVSKLEPPSIKEEKQTARPYIFALLALNVICAKIKYADLPSSSWQYQSK